MKGNHKGFSLMELIVAMAILGIVAIAEITFVTSGSKTYHSVLNDVNLQLDVQTSINQLEDYIINCDGGLCIQGDTLYLLNRKTGGGTEHVFTFDAASNKIYYYNYSLTASGKAVTRSLAESGLMTENVKKFQVDYQTDADGNVSSAKVSITLVQGNETSTKSKTIALRNRPPWADTEDEMIKMADL